MGLAQGAVALSDQHAFSLSELVSWFKRLILAGYVPEDLNRSDILTSSYCDELLEALRNG